MHINQYMAQTLGISRRAADKEIARKFVKINGKIALPPDRVVDDDEVTYRGKALALPQKAVTIIMINKPVGYISSRARDETTAPIVMELLPKSLQHLKSVGRLDKESAGLLLMTDDGALIYKSTHPKFQTEKEYEVAFEHAMTERELVLWRKGMKFSEGTARVHKIERMSGKKYRIILHTGLTRQIRRMAGKTGNAVLELTRIRVGDVFLGGLESGKWKDISKQFVVK